MVKNLPTVERSTKIRFGRNCKEDQAENTIVFNASNIQIDATIPGAVYMTPLRVQEELTDTNVTMMTYNTATKELMDSGVLASDVLLYDLDDVTFNGNSTTNTVIFKGNTAFITYSNTTGISNSAPVHTLDVGSNLYIQDTGSNVLNVTGNANVTDALTTKELYVTNDTRIYGNLDVMGVLTSLRTENTTINDAIIKIANNNTISTTDMGIVMTKPETSVGIGYRGHENEFMVGFTQSDASGTDLVPDSSNLIQMRVYGDLHVSNAFDVATRASIGSNVVIDDDVAETISVTGNVYTSRAAKVGSNAIIDTLASNVISVTGNTYTSHAVIVGSNAVIDTLASDVISVTGNAYVSHAIDVGSNIVLDDRSSDVLSLTGNAYVSRGIDVGSNVIIDTLGSDSIRVIGNIHSSRKITVGTHLTLDTLGSNVVQVTGNTFTSHASIIGSNITLDDQASNVVELTGNANVSRAVFVGSNVTIDDQAEDVLTLTGNANVSRAVFVGSNVALDDQAEDVLTLTGNAYVSHAIDIGSNVVIDDQAEVVLTLTGNAYVSHAIDIGSNVVIDDQAEDVLTLTGNAHVSRAIDIGSNVVIDDLASNVLNITGDAKISDTLTANYVSALEFYGDGGILSNVNLQVVSDKGNSTTQTLQFTNPTTAFTTDLVSNVEVKLDQLSNVVIAAPQTDHILTYDGSNWVNEYNIHNFIKVHNLTGSTLYKGNVVYIVNSFNNNVANVALAKSNSSATMPAIGLIHENILNGEEGAAVAYGKVTGLNTTGYIEGQTIYVSNIHSGRVMNTKPYGLGDQIQNVGICIKAHQNNGVIFVTGVGRSNDIPNAPLETVTSPYVYVNTANNNLRKIVPSNLLTKLQTLEQVVNTGNVVSNVISASGFTATGDVAIGGLTENYIPIVGSNNILVDSPIRKDNGSIIIAADTEINGNLIVTGNSYVVSSNNVVIEDRILGLANNNPSHDYDVGVIMEHPGHNIALIHHGDEDRFSMGYTQNTVTDNHVLPDSNVFFLDILGNVEVQNNLVVNERIGISNLLPDHDLSVGSNLYVDDSGADVLVVTGNVLATRFIGDGGYLSNIASTFEDIIINGNTASNTVELRATTSLVATGNVGISNLAPEHDLSVGSNLYIDDDGADVLVVTGNVLATRFIGDGGYLSNIASTFEDIIINGNTASNTVELRATTSLVTTGNVGISNLAPDHDLSVGSNLYVDDSGADVLVVTGNVLATRFIGDGGYLSNIASTFEDIIINGNTASNTVQLQATTSLVTTGNVGISNLAPEHDLSVGSNLYIDDDGADILVVTGNVLATRFIGDGGYLSNIASTFEDIIINGNTASNTVELRAATSLVTTGTVGIANTSPDYDLSVGSNLHVDDDGSNVLIIYGNTAMDALTLGLGEVTIVPSYGLNHVTAEYNQTGDTIVLTNPTTGLIVNSNINVGSNIVFSGGASIQGLNLAPTASNIMTYDATTGEVFDSGGLISNKLAVVSEQPSSALTGVSTMIPQHGVYTVSTSTLDAYKVFDKAATHWASGAIYTGANNTYNGASELFSGGELGEWIKMEIPYKTILRHISLTPAVDVASFPGSGYVYASNDDVTWTQLKTWSGIIPSSLTDIKKIAIDATVAYTKYAIVPTQAAGTSTSVNIGEWKLFTESFVIDGGIMSVTGNVGIGTSTPVASLHINATDSIVLPSGTTSERPSTTVEGMLRYNSETGYLEAYTAGGWGSIATPPTITSFSGSGVNELTINGGFFDENTSVQLRAQDGTLYSTTNFVFTNSGLIKVNVPSVSNGSYTVVVTNGAGISTDSTTQLLVTDPPVWSSPAAGATLSFFTDSSSTITFSVSDPDGDTVTYSLVSGTLPPGLTLSGSTISGTSGASDGTLTPITIRAGDGLSFADRSFTIETSTPLYSFSSHTFTNAGQTGRTGPILTQMRNAYTPSWTDNTNYFNQGSYQGYQLWTVPKNGTYRFEVAGARGGGGQGYPSYSLGGKGGYTVGSMSLSKGTKLTFIVGQSGQDNSASNHAGGGGGASWVLSQNLATLYAVAGGGGGSSANNQTSGAYGGDGGSSQAPVSSSYGGSQGPNWSAGGGAGFSSDGGGYPNNKTGGTQPGAGAYGGLANNSWYPSYYSEGGFGGGGGCAAHGPGAGGGYGGGSVVGYTYIPGSHGGTTRNNMTSPTFSTHTGQHGYITVTLL